MVNPNFCLHIIPYTELIAGIQPFVHALFYLAVLPEDIRPLRAEAEEVTEREGWTKRPWIRCTRSTVSSRTRSERLRWEIVSAAPSCV